MRATRRRADDGILALAAAAMLVADSIRRVRIPVVRGIGAVRHGGALLLLWLRLQWVLVEFARECRDFRRLAWLRWQPDPELTVMMLDPGREISRNRGIIERDALRRMHRRLVWLCVRKTPPIHPLTSSTAIRLQGTAAEAVLRSWFGVPALSGEGRSVAGRYGSVAWFLRDLLAHTGAPFGLATRERVREQLPRFLAIAETSLNRPKFWSAASDDGDWLVLQVRRALDSQDVAPDMLQAQAEREIQRQARNRLALSLAFKASHCLLDRILANPPSLLSVQRMEAAWDTATLRIESLLNKSAATTTRV